MIFLSVPLQETNCREELLDGGDEGREEMNDPIADRKLTGPVGRGEGIARASG
jgi:hypothetical protein